MSRADEDRFASMFDSGDWLPTVTRDAVASALDGFALSLVHGKDMDWLTMATRRSLAGAHRYPAVSSGRISNAKIRANLKRLADLAGSIWQKLFQLDHATDYRLLDYATQHWDGEGGTDLGDGVFIGDPSDYRRFKSAVAELDWLASFLRQGAKATESQHGPWRQKEERRVRIERGQYLAPIFEAAFGQPISANNWSGSNWSGRGGLAKLDSVISGFSA